MKCNKVKNPCKICFQSVSKKNGLQCQGACQKWAHFKCLNYTPGKIQDIKAGVIKITCPCPDCNTAGPKEILTDPPFTCTNTQCPANKLPVCESIDCPSNEKPIPTYPPSQYESHRSPCPPPRSPCPPPRSPCPPPKSPCPPPKSPCPAPKSPCPAPKSPCPAPKSSCPPPPCAVPKPQLPPRSPSPSYPSRDDSSPCPPVCPPNCPSYQKVKHAKKSFSPKQSQSCSDISNESSSSARQFDKMRTVASDSKLPSAGVDPKILFSAIESLCNTVGQLSNQLRNLMCKMQAGYRA